MLDYMYANADRINLFVGYIGMAMTLIAAVALFLSFRKESHRKAVVTHADSITVTSEVLMHYYHELALFHASIQFWFSIIAAVIGFLFIMVMMLTVRNAEWFEYFFKVLPGAIIEVVSALFFKQSAEIRKQTAEYYDKLRNEEQINKSIEIVNSIEDADIRAKVKTAIALHICGIETSKIEDRDIT